MAEVVLFGGTTEGRIIAELLQKKGVSTVVCVATEYGESLLVPGGSVRVHRERLDESGMETLLRQEKPRMVLDATHPYADDVTRRIRAACEAVGVPCHRVRRERQQSEDCMEFADLASAVAWLSSVPGVIFSSLGSKEAEALTALPDFAQRVWLRILPSQKGLAQCLAAGFPPKHIICMQGPFSRELNEAMFRAAGAEILLTKESGAAGGFGEKLAAARRCGMTVAVLRRPEDSDGLTAQEWMQRIEEGKL